MPLGAASEGEEGDKNWGDGDLALNFSVFHYEIPFLKSLFFYI